MNSLEIQVRVYVLQNNVIDQIRKVKVYFLNSCKTRYENYELVYEKGQKKQSKPILHLYCCIDESITLTKHIERIKKDNNNKTGVSNYIMASDLEGYIKDLKCNLTYQRNFCEKETKEVPIEKEILLLSSRDEYKYSYLLWPSTEGCITIFLEYYFSVNAKKLNDVQTIHETVKVENTDNIVGYDVYVDFSNQAVELSLKRFMLKEGLIKPDENFKKPIKTIELKQIG